MSVNVEEIVSDKSTEAVVSEIKRLINYQEETDFQALNSEITKRAKDFKQNFEASLASPDPSKHEEEQLDHWVESDVGKKTLSSLVSACVDLVGDDSYNGPPAHDRAHCLKDLYSGLIAIQEDPYRPYEKIGATIGSLMHDFGKTLEVPLTGKHSTGVVATDHANIGFFLADQLTKSVGGMPKGLEDQILYSIITHQEGKSKEVTAQLVQRADREQLVGAEGVRRMFISDAGLEHRQIDTKINPIRNSELALPAKPDDTDLFHHIEFYIRNLYPQIGSQGSNRAENLKAEAGIFLWIASPDEIRQQIFAPEIARDAAEQNGQEYVQGANKFKKILNPETWKKIKNGPKQENLDEIESLKSVPLNKLLEQFISRKNTNLSWQTKKDSEPENVLENLQNQIGNLSEEKKQLLHAGLSYALVRVNRHEEEMVQGASNMANRTVAHSAENEIANLILSKYK
jgi:hypothetical protein